MSIIENGRPKSVRQPKILSTEQIKQQLPGTVLPGLRRTIFPIVSAIWKIAPHTVRPNLCTERKGKKSVYIVATSPIRRIVWSLVPLTKSQYHFSIDAL